MNPLDRLRSIKLKLGLVILAAIATVVCSMLIVSELGFRARWGALAATILALVVVQLLARGLTAPLREMAAAAKAMARGQHGQRVEVRGRDEVAQLAVSFNAMSAELAEVDRQRRELVANVSHELRTPISAVQASLENVIDGVQEPDPEVLAAMHAQLDRLGRMVSQLLDLSRMEAEGPALEIRSFPALRLLGRVRDEAAIGNGTAALDIDIDPSELRIEGDEERLQQVVSNLVDNALRYSPPAEPVQVKAVGGEHGVRLEVIDAGPGIPPQERERIFERFYRVEASRAGNGGGAGLGLAIAGWIVAMHDGSIHAEQPAAGGTRMVVELPRDPQATNGGGPG